MLAFSLGRSQSKEEHEQHLGGYYPPHAFLSEGLHIRQCACVTLWSRPASCCPWENLKSETGPDYLSLHKCWKPPFSRPTTNDSTTLFSTKYSGALTAELTHTPRHHAALAGGEGSTLLDWKCGVIIDEVPRYQRSSQQKPADSSIQPELQFWASWRGKRPRRRRHFEGDSAHPARFVGSVSSTVGLDACEPTTHRACWANGCAPCCCSTAACYSVLPYRRYQVHDTSKYIYCCTYERVTATKSSCKKMQQVTS